MAHGTNTQPRPAEPEPWSLDRELAKLGPCPQYDGGQTVKIMALRVQWMRALHALHAQDQFLRAGHTDRGAPAMLGRQDRVEVALLADDAGTETRRQRSEIERTKVGKGDNRRTVTRVAHPLERYLRRKEITADQYKAGTRFRADYFRAQALPGLTTRYGEWGGNQIRAAAYMPEVFDRARSFDAAVRSVGAQQSLILVWVCGEGRSAADYAKERGWNPAHGMGALKLALDSAVEHYGMEIDNQKFLR